MKEFWLAILTQWPVFYEELYAINYQLLKKVLSLMDSMLLSKIFKVVPIRLVFDLSH